MVKKLLAGLALICLTPLLANAWFFNTAVKTVGGSMTSRNMTNQRSTNGSVFKSYTTHAPLSLAISADAGYSIRSVVINNVDLGAQVSPFFTTVQGMTDQTVTTSFAVVYLSVTAQATGSGTVAPTSVANITYGTRLASPLVFSFTPATDNYVSSVTGATGATISPALPAAANTQVKVTYPAGFTFTAPVALTGTFLASKPIANAGANQLVLSGDLVTLKGSNVGADTATSYTWNQVSGPASVTLTPSGPNATFVAPGSAGDYVFRLTLTGGSTASTTVTVTTSVAAAGRNMCQNCHTGNKIGSAQLFYNWSTSTHKAQNITCDRCHTGADAGAHPGSVTPGTVSATSFTYLATGANFCSSCHVASIASDFNGSKHAQNSVSCASCHNDPHNPKPNLAACDACHRDQSGQVVNHPLDIGSTGCLACHSPHSLSAAGTQMTPSHYTNVTGARYPASYVTSRAACSDCHIANTANHDIRHAWSESAHGAVTAAAWTYDDFKTRSGCVQCHTTTGFVAYSTGKVNAAWGHASDKTKEVLTCRGCHVSVATGQLRRAVPNKAFADDSFVNHEVGSSNLCMDCHGGRLNGASIEVKVAAGAAFSNMSFVAPHYMAAGGTLQGRGGYHFPGQSYASYTSPTHLKIGQGNLNNTGSGGPCVGCHMTSGVKHSWQALSKDTQGAIVAISSSACANCHSGYLDAQRLSSNKAAFDDSLAVLKAMLAERGFSYQVDYPYFTNTNWGMGQDGANVMGAAFNYQLLFNEHAIYVHNPAYAQKLILDSIDYLYNGSVTGSVNGAADYLLAKGSIGQAAAGNVKALTGRTSCTSCHGGTSSSTRPMATGSHGVHLTGDYGPGAYLGSTTSSCQACHQVGGAAHRNGVVNFNPNACGGCHPFDTLAWSTGGRLPCIDCHAANASTLPNGVAAPNKAYFLFTGHGQYAGSNQCTDCHDANSRHIAGSLGAYTRLTLVNDSTLCASCHNSTKVGATYRYMVTHVDKGLTCQECHDPHGTSNRSMIRAGIKGVAIGFYDAGNCVDLVTNRGLCQVCHTKTNHYRAGVTESGHYSSGCLGCHNHNSEGGAFKPIAGSGCDSCHGYPPAPKNLAGAFGTSSNWVGGRFEDYSGGGGAHLIAAHITPFAQPEEGWSNCTICHNGGRTLSQPYHRMILPVKENVANVRVEVDPKFRFSPRQMVYTGARQLNPPQENATGRCSNIACHMRPSKRWSGDR